DPRRVRRRVRRGVLRPARGVLGPGGARGAVGVVVRERGRRRAQRRCALSCPRRRQLGRAVRRAPRRAQLPGVAAAHRDAAGLRDAASYPCSMDVVRAPDPTAFLEATDAYRASEPARTTVMGSVAASVAEGTRQYDECFWWVLREDGEVVAAAFRT